jgi:hypothetical protein
MVKAARAEDLVALINPNHDEEGQFSKGPGGFRACV